MKCLRTKIFTLAGLLLSSLAFSHLSYAADCAVDSNAADGDPGSLRDCITAVATTDGDTVTIPANTTALLDLPGQISIINNNIKIVGAGDGTSIIDGNMTDRIFFIDGVDVEISGVTLQNGKVLMLSGGAIRNTGGGSVKIVNSMIKDNTADLYGGAIENEGILVLESVQFDNNQVLGQSGGAINNLGTLSVRNSEFTLNKAEGGNALSRGGAIAQGAGSTTQILDSTFSANSSSSSGGAIFVQEGILSITGSNFRSNTAGASGGAIDNGLLEGSLVDIHHSIFVGNQAAVNGGAIFNLPGGQLSIENTDISSDNAALGGFGGGIASYGLLFVKNSTINSNKAAGVGAGIAILNLGPIFPGATIENSRIEGNKGEGSGAGIASCSDETTIRGTTVVGNETSDGSGAGIFNECGEMTISNSTISGNKAALDGGGIYNDDTLVINNVTIAGNQADIADGGLRGGGIFNASSLRLSNSIIAGNTTLGGIGLDCFNADGDLLAGASNIIQVLDPQECLFSGNAAGILNVDPVLDPSGPQDNGGFTPTIALLSGSPALNAGDNDSCETIDQRGVARPQGSACDLGAYEAAPLAELAPDLDFGDQQVATVSAAQQVTFTNTGVIDVAINSINIDGDFAQTNDCGPTVAPGASCTFDVTFTPTVEGIRDGSLTVDSSAGVLSVALTGNGFVPAPPPPPVPGPVNFSGAGISCQFNPQANPAQGLGVFAILGLGLAGLVALRRYKA